MRDPTKATRKKRDGKVSIDSRPEAAIQIGAYRDTTPVYRHALAPGRHQVRATLPDGRSQTFDVRIVPGQVTSRILSWDKK